jgi:hypothetical protein
MVNCQQPFQEPKVQVLIPVYEPLDVTKCRKWRFVGLRSLDLRMVCVCIRYGEER